MSSSSKPRATPTAHLRKTIQKVSRHPRQRHVTNPKTEIPSCLTATITSEWVSIAPFRRADRTQQLIERCNRPLRDAIPSKATAETVVPHAASNNDVKIKSLVDILNQLAKDFKSSGKPYCAMAASAAVRMVQHGKQDDINPGLWRFIRCVETRNNAECADI